MCVVSVGLSDARSLATSHLLYRWVSVELGVLERYSSGIILIWKERDVYSVKDRRHRVSERGDKCIKNGSEPWCHFVWWGSSGVTDTLTGSIKDEGFQGKGNDLLEAEVSPGLRLTFLNSVGKLSQCVSSHCYTYKYNTVSIQAPKKTQTHYMVL